jgi:hypothetical protein
VAALAWQPHRGPGLARLGRGLASLALAAAATSCAGGRVDARAAPTATAPLGPTPTANIVVSGLAYTPTPGSSPTPYVWPEVLLLGEHLSSRGSYTETETSAAGPMLCRVERDSCAFRQLVSDLDPKVLFSEGEPPPYGAEDRMMNPAMVLPLSTLADLVAAEWGANTQVMVTEAYDSLLDHHNFQPDRDLRYSLHFEGRSLDLITWPPDEQRNGRLCVLALQAGFDWAHNEGDHCHVSLNADSVCALCSGAAPP